MSITETIQLVSVSLTAASVLVAALAICVGLRGVKKQMFVAVFNQYTQRYANIMDGLPAGTRDPKSKITLEDLDEKKRQEVLRVGRRYFNLCSEEMWLAQKGHLDQTTWGIWETGIRQTMRLQSMSDAWEELESEYEYFGEFHEFMNEIADE